jgi:hypothetical protein
LQRVDLLKASREGVFQHQEEPMAQFCTKCGTSLPEGMRFCTGCGAVIGEAVAPSSPAATAATFGAPLTPSPVAAVGEVAITGQPVPPPYAPATGMPAKNSPVLKIVLIVVAILIFFGVLSAGACVYFVYRAKQRVNQFEKQARARMNAPAGTWRIPEQPGTSNQPSSSVVDAGIPVYPGAIATEGPSQVLGMAGFKVQQYTTGDSVSQVVAFYKDKLGPGAVVMQSGDQASIRIAGSNAIVTIAVALDNAAGNTKIVVTRIGKQ